MSVVVLLPAELAKSRNREISLLEPSTIRRLRGFTTKLVLAILFAIPMTVFWGPVGMVALTIDLYYWIRVIWIIRESYSKKVFDVSCPNCEKVNRHWGVQNFICTECRHLLMRHGERVFDITASDVRTLLDGATVNANYSRTKAKVRKI
jgi:hypothetical protein